MIRLERVTKVSILLIAGAAGTGCGGDEDSTNPIRRAGTVQKITWNLGLVLREAAGPRAMPAFVMPPPVCHTGSREASAITRDSPFSTSPLTGESAVYVDCLTYPGPPADPLDNGSLRRGVEESAQAGTLGGGLIEYRYIGSEDGTGPMELHFYSSTGAGRSEDIHLTKRLIHSYSAVIDGKYEYEALVTSSIAHSSRPAGGPRFDVGYRIGTATDPFRISSRDYVSRLSGDVAFESGPCTSGPMHVETVDDLVYDTSAGRVVAGTLRFTFPDGEATATLNADGSATLRSAEGEHRMVPPSGSQEDWGLECLGAVTQ